MTVRRYRNKHSYRKDSDNKNQKSIIYKVVLTLLILIFVSSLAILINILVIQPHMNNKLNDEIRSIYNQSDEQTSSHVETREERFKRLLSLNSDIKGWINIPNTVIDYPVLYSTKQPNFYLYRDYNKNYTKYGSIFIDSTITSGIDAKNIVLHGHNMNNGQMFAGILKFSDLDFYKSTPVIDFDTPEESSKWKIISVFKTNTDVSHGKLFEYIIGDFNSDSEFLNYVYNVRVRSLIDTPVDINEDDKLLTLSTCSYEIKDFRTVVVARKVRPNESIEVDINNAKLAKNPLMPEYWYKKNGGTMPKVTTFEKALKNGKIDWYKSKNDK